MINKKSGIISILVLGMAVSSCVATGGAPTYTNDKEAARAPSSAFSDLAYHVYDSYNDNPPDCVAILPFTKTVGESSDNTSISIDQTEVVRRALYAHLAPHGKRDVEIPRVDFVLKKMDEADRGNMAKIGESLNCDALITGNVTEYGEVFLGIASRVAVGAQLRMMRASTNEILWEASHEAGSNSGSVPMSPIGLATGVLEAALNLQEENTFKVLDELARHLVATIPDNRIAVLEEPMAPIKVAVHTKPENTLAVDDFIAGLSALPAEEQKQSLLAAINERRFAGDDMSKLYETLIAATPGDAAGHGGYAHFLVEEGDYTNALRYAYNSLSLDGGDGSMHFLKGRIQIKLNDLGGADSSIVQAIAIDPSNAAYLNGLGYLNSLRGNNERALAAYQMAIDQDPDNGFSHYNMGVTYYNGGDLNAARNAFFKSGLAYLKAGNYGQVQKAVVDLREVASHGVSIDYELTALEEALASLKASLEENGHNDV